MAQKRINLDQIESGKIDVLDLEVRLASIDTAISDEATARETADSGLDTRIDTLETANSNIGETIQDTVGAMLTDTNSINATYNDETGTETLDLILDGDSLAIGISGVKVSKVDADVVTVANLETDNFKTGVIDTDGTLTANSDTVIATQKAVKTYVDTEITALENALASGLLYKGTFDASVGTYAALDNASQGDFYKVSVDGTIGTRDYQVGDMIIVNKDVVGTPVEADLDKIDNTEAPDIVRTDATQILTNKTIDLDSNTLSNIELDNFKTGVIDTDLSSVSANDDTLATAKAIKAYIDAQVVIAIATARTHTITNHTALANETNVAITVPAYVLGNNNLMVFRNGVYLIPGSGEYTETDTTTITVAFVKKNDVITIVN